MNKLIWQSNSGPQSRGSHPPWVRYAAAVMAVGTFAIGRLLLDPLLGDHLPFVTFYGAVAVATWFGGLGPGLASIIMGLLAADYLFIAPRYSTGFDKLNAGVLVGNLSFCAVALIICATGEALRRTILRAQRSMASLADTERQLSRVLQSIRDGLLVIDAQMRFAYINEAAKQILTARGVKADELLGTHLFDKAFAAAKEDVWARALCRAMEKRTPSGTETYCEQTRRWYSSRFYPTDDGGVSAFVHDVTERVQATQRLQIQHAVTSALATSESLEKAAGDILKGICNATGSNVASLWLVDWGADLLRCVEVFASPFHRGNNFVAHTRAQTFARGCGLPGQVWASGEPTWIPDVTKAGNFPRVPFAAAERLHAAFAAPILSDGENIGVIEFFMSEVRQPDEPLLELIASISIQIGQFIRHKQAQQKLAETSKALEQTNRELEQRVQERTARLTQTISELESLSYSIIHDFRAPLRIMHTCAQYLLEECAPRLGADGEDYVGRIMNSSRRMDHLVRDVLAYAHVVRSHLELRPVDTDKLVRGILDSYPQLHSSKADVRIEGVLPAVLANEAALTQCFSSLLDNAVKFAPPDVFPIVRIGAESGETAAVRLWVQDNGIGIDREYWERVFQMFQRLDKNYRGTGVGLAITKKAVERMGGKIGLESEPSAGSRFWIELPGATLAKAPAPSIESAFRPECSAPQVT